MNKTSSKRSWLESEDFIGNDNVVLVSHHPRHRSSSPAATVYEIWLSLTARLSPRGFIEVNASEAPNANIYGEDTTFLFNSLGSLHGRHSLQLLHHLARRNARVAVFWHETAWAMRSQLTSSPALADSIATLQLCRPVHLVPTRQGISPVVLLTGSPVERVFPIYEALPLKNFAVKEPATQPELHNRKLRVVSSGYLDTRKGFDVFCSLAEEVPDCDFSWVSTHTRVPRRKSGAVEVLGRMPSQGFRSFLNGADLFVSTARDDPSPIVCLEALSSGLPVFCFASTGTAEIVPPEWVARDEHEMLQMIREHRPNKFDRQRSRVIAEAFSQDQFVLRLKSINRALKRSNFDGLPVPPGKASDVLEGLRITDLPEPADRLKSDLFSPDRLANLCQKHLGVAESLPTLARLGREIQAHLGVWDVSGKTIVVGNGPSLLAHGFGAQIDSHAQVVRLNDFVIKGFEQHVGTRTTHSVVSPSVRISDDLAEFLASRGALVFSGRHDWTSRDSRSRLAKGIGGSIEKLAFDDAPGTYLAFLTGSVREGQPKWISTGLAGLIFALLAGSPLPVHIVGFDLWRAPNSQPIQHYQKQSTKLDGCHDFHAEASLVAELIACGFVKGLDFEITGMPAE